MKAKVTWLEGMCFEGLSESGHKMVLDGTNPGKGASPMEAVLLGAGGCSAIDVVSILEKGRQQVTGCYVELDADRAEKPPRVFTAIRLHFVVTGQDLAEKQVARAVELSMHKYCSVMKMLEKAVTVESSFEIRNA
ncbi:putative redox protein [Oceanisphaera litoralis]|uniref:OsmC family protein n=1 Tax=Oceanisphaera litoralis TaxID=225144 RepID=UPI001958B9EE|nr:OsmC family protein [Oceanisphaera litoralis]MBM7455710.1 putative redox protein [Oceanisphaera litoralis]